MGGYLCGTGRHAFLTPEDLADVVPCCYGSADRGPAGCTCWEPVFDLEQEPPRPRDPITRRRRCHDCAFRPDSPERLAGEALEELPNFWCHQGTRRASAYRHADGRVRPVVDQGDYQPPIREVPFKADGSPADRCAGWAQAQRLLARAAS